MRQISLIALAMASLVHLGAAAQADLFITIGGVSGTSTDLDITIVGSGTVGATDVQFLSGFAFDGTTIPNTNAFVADGSTENNIGEYTNANNFDEKLTTAVALKNLTDETSAPIEWVLFDGDPGAGEDDIWLAFFAPDSFLEPGDKWSVDGGSELHMDDGNASNFTIGTYACTDPTLGKITLIVQEASAIHEPASLPGMQEKLDRVSTDQAQKDDEQQAARQEAIASLKGKVGYLIHRKGTEPRTLELSEGIVAESIRPEDLGTVPLEQYDVIFFPAGPRYQLDESHDALIRDYVRNGGGYVGSCQGSFYAAQLKLLDVEAYTLNIWGLFKVRLKPHALTDLRGAEIPMHFGNGPVMVPGDDCQVIATYVMTLPGKATPAAIVTGTFGSGRVVAFGPHPMGGKVSAKGVRAYWSGDLLETERMLVNALLYASNRLPKSP